MKFQIKLEFEVTDREAAQLNARLLGADTTPALKGGFSTQVDADTASEALAEAFAMAHRFQSD
jgi:hypothetical protein